MGCIIVSSPQQGLPAQNGATTKEAFPSLMMARKSELTFCHTKLQNGKNHLSSLIACKQTLFIILKILESSTIFYAFTLQSQKVYAFMDLLIDQVARSTCL